MNKLLLTLATLLVAPGSHATASNNKFAYITTLGDTPFPIVRCKVNPLDGTFNHCINSGYTISGLTRPGQLVFSNGYAYVTTYVGPVDKCDVDSNGILSNCVVAVSLPGTNIIGIAFKKTTSGQLYAYIGDGNQNGQIWQCPVDPVTGSFGTCSAISQQFANGVLFETLKNFNGTDNLYVPDGNYGNPGQQVWKCPIDPLTGAIPNPCPDSGAGPIFNGPDAIAFSECTLRPYAYVANYNSSVVNLCRVDDQGKLSDCGTLSQAFNVPNQMVLRILNHVNYFYITNAGAGEVIQCEIKLDGTLTACQTLLSGLGFPFGLTFN